MAVWPNVLTPFRYTQLSVRHWKHPVSDFLYQSFQYVKGRFQSFFECRLMHYISRYLYLVFSILYYMIYFILFPILYNVRVYASAFIFVTIGQIIMPLRLRTQ